MARMMRWRLIANGFYAVSELGHVRRERPARGTFVGKILKYKYDKDGYAVVTIACEGRNKQRKVHLLVAEAFLGPRPEGKEVNHKDGNTGNPRLCNLEYKTPIENMEHAARTELMAKKLSTNTVKEIRAIGSGLKQKDLAKKFSVSQSLISKVLAGELWKYGGTAWGT